MIRILFVHHGRGLGGSPVSLASMIAEFAKFGIHSEILCLRDSQAVGYFINKGIRVHLSKHPYYTYIHIPIAHSDANPVFISKRPFKYAYQVASFTLSSLIAFCALAKYRNNYDILYLNSISLVDFLPASRLLFDRVLIQCREPLSFGFFGLRKSLIQRYIRKFASAVVCCSSNYADRIDVERKLTVRDFSDSPSVCPHHIATLSITALYVGGTSELKGFNKLLSLLPSLHKTITINVLGCLDTSRVVSIFYEGKYISIKVSELPSVYPQLNLIGSVEDTSDYLNNCRILLNLFERPHFSRPIIEAYSYGRVVLATRVHGIEELVEHGKTGFVFDDVSELGTTLNSLIYDNDSLVRMSNHARKCWEQNYSPKNMELLIKTLRS